MQEKLTSTYRIPWPRCCIHSKQPWIRQTQTSWPRPPAPCVSSLFLQGCEPTWPCLVGRRRWRQHSSPRPLGAPTQRGSPSRSPAGLCGNSSEGSSSAHHSSHEVSTAGSTHNWSINSWILMLFLGWTSRPRPITQQKLTKSGFEQKIEAQPRPALTW